MSSRKRTEQVLTVVSSETGSTLLTRPIRAAKQLFTSDVNGDGKEEVAIRRKKAQIEWHHFDQKKPTKQKLKGVQDVVPGVYRDSEGDSSVGMAIIDKRGTVWSTTHAPDERVPRAVEGRGHKLVSAIN